MEALDPVLANQTQFNTLFCLSLHGNAATSSKEGDPTQVIRFSES